MVTSRSRSGLALAVLAVIIAGCDREPALPPAWGIRVRKLDAQALGLVDADHPAKLVAATAKLVDYAAPTLPTPDGSGQASDPDVIVDPAADQVLLAATPFPYADTRAENPSLFATTDGASYTVPLDGEVNPIAPPPPDFGHDAEPDLRYDPQAQMFDLLYLIDRSTSQTLVSVRTADPTTWTAAEPTSALIFNFPAGDHPVASPTTVIDAAGTTWLFLIDATTAQIVARTASDGATWTGTPAISIDLAGIAPHKIDVVGGPTGRYAMLITGAPAGDAHDNVYVATSPDLRTWTFSSTPLIDAGLPALDARALGRASGLISGTALWVWFGVESDPTPGHGII